MKRFTITLAFLLGILITGISASASSIDLISQEYEISGTNIDGLTCDPFIPGSCPSISIRSSMPPLIAPFNDNFYDLHADGGVSGGSLFVDLSATAHRGNAVATADLIFRVIESSSLDLSYLLSAHGTAGLLATLYDSTTDTTVISLLGFGDGVSPVPTVVPFPLPDQGSFRLPVVPSDTYLLSVGSFARFDSAVARITLTAVPEPSVAVLLISGLGLLGLRKRLVR